MSWYNTGTAGEEALVREEKRREEARAASSRLYRFWLPSNASTHISFLDEETSPFGYDAPFTFMEHQLNLNGSWKNWFTCLAGMRDQDGTPIECPLCAGGDTPYLAAAYTIIDHSEWTDKRGKVHRDEVKLFVVKSQVLKILRKSAAKKKGLRGWFVEVARLDAQSANTGEQFDFEERRELDSKLVAPDYREAFAPKTREQLLEVIGEVQNESSEPIRF